MKNRTYYMNSIGEVYSVSPRIISLGVPPLEGFNEMSEEEKTAYLEGLALERPSLKNILEEKELATETPTLEKKQNRVEAALQRRQARLQRRQEAAEAAKRELEEKNRIFENLSEDQLQLVEVLVNQGLSQDQIRNILIAKQAKQAGKEE